MPDLPHGWTVFQREAPDDESVGPVLLGHEFGEVYRSGSDLVITHMDGDIYRLPLAVVDALRAHPDYRRVTLDVSPD